jgi:hypothetical protein
MSTDTTEKDEPLNRLFRAAWIVGTTFPAAVLTWLGSSVSKDPSDFVREWGVTLPLSVLILPSLLAFAVDTGICSSSPRATGVAFAVAVAVSFSSSILAFVGIMYLFVD